MKNISHLLRCPLHRRRFPIPRSTTMGLIGTTGEGVGGGGGIEGEEREGGECRGEGEGGGEGEEERRERGWVRRRECEGKCE